jgi:anthranilate/para-aminobenzoate synthase component I
MTGAPKPRTMEIIDAGGAITTLSDSSAEWEEAMLKSRAIVRAVEACDELAARGAAP